MEPEEIFLTDTIELIESWRKGTQTGDRAEIEELPEDLPFWNDMSASAENCIGSDCPQFQECIRAPSYDARSETAGLRKPPP